jgi:osmoprotectant transport system permease protein
MSENILSLTLEHLMLVSLAVLAASLIAIPTAIWSQRNPRAGSLILKLTDIIQTIPSLALFGLLLPLPLIGGIGAKLAIFVLFLYALLPILRNTLLGLNGISEEIRESAIALGMTPPEVLREIEIPLAAPSIITGLRIATVTTIGTATVAAAIGAGGLGVLLYRGLATVETELLLAGALPAAALAILADQLFQWIEDKLSTSPQPR